jgi:hypothetical protein
MLELERKRRRGLTNLARWPTDPILVRIDAINHQFSSSPNIMDGILQDLHAARRLHHDIKAIRIFRLDLLEHRLRVRSAQGDVFVGGIEALGEVDLETLGGGDDDVAPAVLTQHLREDEAGGAGAEHEDRGTHLGGDLVKAVGGAGGGLQEGGVDVGEVLNGEDAAGWIETH